MRRIDQAGRISARTGARGAWGFLSGGPARDALQDGLDVGAKLAEQRVGLLAVALAGGEILGELVAVEEPLAVIVLATPIGRIEIEQRLRAVITRQHLLPGQVLEDQAIEPVMSGIEQRADLG